MSPFQSKAQMKAAFSGGLGSEMQSKAKEFADATPDISALPEHKKKKHPPKYGAALLKKFTEK